MSERYTKVFSLSENLYAKGSPVIISAGALLKDNTTGKILAQLKIKNISDKNVKAVTVRILPSDVTGKRLGEEVTYQYLDLNVHRDEEFGSKTPIELPADSTRGFSVSVAEVLYSDNSIDEVKGGEWEKLEEPVTLEKELNDSELLRQYRINYGTDCIYKLKEEKSLWICTCGAINREGEECCHKCKRIKKTFETIDIERLKEDAEKRKNADIEAEKLKIQKEKKARRIVAVAAACIAVVVVFVSVLTHVILPSMKYNEAEKLLAEGYYAGAISAFEELGEYKDATDRAKSLKEEFPYITGYNKAEKLFDEGNYMGASEAFEELGDYKDAAERAKEAEEKGKEVLYNKAESILNEGQKINAAIDFGKLGDFKDSKVRSRDLWNSIPKGNVIDTNGYNSVGVKSDGTVVAVGTNLFGEGEVSGWNNIKAISSGGNHTVGLKTDGTVVATGYNNAGECNVSEWTDIVDVSAGDSHTIGLKSDGTVLATGENFLEECDVAGWNDIESVSAGYSYTIGLKSNGNVVATGFNRFGQCDVSGWTDIVAVAAGTWHTVGLRTDGTVVATGSNDYGQCDLLSWTDIIAVAADGEHTIGLRSDGTVIAAGSNSFGECDVKDWAEIVAIATGDNFTIGIKSDGTVVHTGLINEDFSAWTDMKIPK